MNVERLKMVMKKLKTMNVKKIIKNRVDNGYSTDINDLYSHSLVNRN